MNDHTSSSAPVTTAEPNQVTLLERGMPFREISLVINADRRALDPVYGVHRWWARRPPALLRAALVAAALPADVGPAHFWDAYRSPVRTLDAWRVYDPFSGGGCTLVEAARLGARVAGGDIDPLAVEIARYELDPAPGDEVRTAGARLLEHLRAVCGHLYPSGADCSPLHYFWVHEVTCPSCGQAGLLYRDLVLARDAGKPGAVVRDAELTVFCPADLSVHELNRRDRRQFRYRDRTWRIHEGTFERQRYTCADCGARATHRELLTGAAPRRLVAVEETRSGHRRRLRNATRRDRAAIVVAEEWLQARRDELAIPTAQLSTDRHDDRPLSFGLSLVADLFNPRQLAVLGTAFRWVDEADLAPRLRTALRLALSNALATNNKLCSYATDYGRLSALFSVRGYSLPALPVELNPLHADGGRGTLTHCIERVARGSTTAVRRYTWNPTRRAVEPTTVTLTTAAATHDVTCTPASASPGATPPVADLCIFDPPYFDYIAYPELSEFYRAWLPSAAISGTPLLPTGNDPAEGFGLNLGVSLRAALARLAPGRPMAFTYHATNPEAWRAVGIALDEAKLRVTALWPVRSDGHMGHHSHPGNCEWDLLVVCRRVTETSPAPCPLNVARWVRAARPLSIGDADRTSMSLAISIAAPRFGELAKEPRT